MKAIKRRLANTKVFNNYLRGKYFLNDPFFLSGQEKNRLEMLKTPTRTEIINFLLSQFNRETTYLEIGVSNPIYNFNKIEANLKYGVEPGFVFPEFPVEFNMTSDAFFKKLNSNEVLSNSIKFDVIFIDGLHLAEQVDKDINNAWKFLNDDGFIVLHDCNPPTEWHAQEEKNYINNPAFGYWNGTTWKAFLKWRFNPTVNSCCINSDWGVGVLSKKHSIGKSINPTNLFYEFYLLEENRKEYLNLIDFTEFKKLLFKMSQNKIDVTSF